MNATICLEKTNHQYCSLFSTGTLKGHNDGYKIKMQENANLFSTLANDCKVSWGNASHLRENATFIGEYRSFTSNVSCRNAMFFASALVGMPLLEQLFSKKTQSC